MDASSSYFSQYPVNYESIEEYVYRGEGNANLVVSLPRDRKVIRFRKSSSDSEVLDDGAARAQHEVEFIRNVISGFLGNYVCVPEILRFDQKEITRLLEQIRPLRPENRKKKDLLEGYATKYPDYTFLPNELYGFSDKPTYSIEIKPKQGYINNEDNTLQKCPYCMQQFLKLKNGEISKRSNYCPLDLFSGNEDRMKRAIEGLLDSPQNNLRIFKDGSLIYGSESTKEELIRFLKECFYKNDDRDCLETFSTIVKTALQRPFYLQVPRDSLLIDQSILSHENFPLLKPHLKFNSDLLAKVKKLLQKCEEECNFTSDKLVEGSVLERILQMQKIHRCEFDFVYWIYSNFSSFLTDDVVYSDLTKAFDSNSDSCSFAKRLDKSEISNYHKSTTLKLKELFSSSIKKSIFEKIRTDIGNTESEKAKHNDDIKENIAIVEYLTILKHYLLFCTAKDCSVLITFQEIDKSTHNVKDSKRTINFLNGQKFLLSVRVIDVDRKSIHSVKKHYQRNMDVLNAVMKILQK